MKKTVAVVALSRGVYSETFIRAHIEHLPANVKEVYVEEFPRYEDGWLEQLLLEHKVDAVLAEFGPTGVLAMGACSRAGVPLVTRFAGYDAYQEDVLRREAQTYPRLFDISAALVAVSRDMQRQLAQLGAPKGKIHYCPSGADTTIFAGSEPAATPPHFVAVGRFVDKKAPHLTLVAFNDVVKVCPEARLTMIGDGPLLDACRQLARAFGIESAVSFMGRRPHKKVAAVMGCARALVQHSIRPSNGDSEGTPNSVMEAGAMGLPVVATRHGGIADVVVDGVTGFLVEERDIKAMAERMTELARDKELAARMGRSARERVHTEFSLRRSIARLWEVIDHASGSRQ